MPPPTLTGSGPTDELRPVSTAAEPACRPPRSTRSLRARVQRGKGTGKVVAITRVRLGSRARTSYAVRLTRDCDVLGSGGVRDSKLVLTLKSTGTKTVTRDGARVRVKTYPRLSGRYLLQPAPSGRPRLPVTRVTFAR